MNYDPLLLLTKASYPTETEHGVKLLIDREFDEREFISLLTNATIRISKIKKGPYYVEQNSTIKPTSPTSNQLLNLILSQETNLKHQHPNHTFNPHIELFSSISEKYGLSNIKNLVQLRNKEVTRQIADTLNHSVDELRTAMQGDEFRAKITNRRRKYQKNKKSVLEYIKSIFEGPNNSTLLVIRIDCAYKAGVTLSYDSIRSHREKLIAYLRSTFKENFLGYVAKLEYGLKKRYHYHWIVFLNGNKLRRDVAIGVIIGNHWNKEITQGAGIYYNCNADKNAYQVKCIGLVRHNSPEFWKGAEILVSYLVKNDYHLSAILPIGHRSLWRGEKSVKKPSSRGRKRLPYPVFQEN